MKFFKGGIGLLIFAVVIYYFFPERKLDPQAKIDKLVVYKSKRVMAVYAGNVLMKTYTISLGDHPEGDKEFEGDERTPEGIYIINDRNSASGYHKNLGISYPNKKDIAEAKAKGYAPGGDIKIHGLKNGTGFIGKFQRWRDWTNGCIALTNDEVDELYKCVITGATIEIYP